MKSLWRKGMLLGALATAVLAVGCSGKGTRDLEEQNRILQQGLDDLQRRNAALEKENTALKADDQIRDAYIKKLEKEAALARRIQQIIDEMGQVGEGMRKIPGGWSLEGDFFFRSGSDDVSKEGVESLRKLADGLKGRDIYLRIVGHTDNDPIVKSKFASNRDLSLGRAMAVLHYLVDEAAIADGQCVVAGWGPYRPVAGNDTSAHKAKNRRVEIVVNQGK